MSLRTFTFSMAANFLVAGVVWYLTGPKGGIICLAVGVVLIILALFLPKKKKGEGHATPPQSPININLSNIGNPVQNQSNRQDASSTALAGAPASGEESRRRKPKTNIKFVETRSIHVSESYGTLNGSPHLGDSEAGVVCFRNETILGQPPQQPNVRAHIIFRDSDGGEITDSSAGVWLGTGGSAVQFTCGDKRCLVVFALGENGHLFKIWAEKIRARVAGRPRTIWETGHSELAKPIAAVEVHLLADWSGGGLFHAVFDVEPYVNRQLPKLELRSSSAE